ncbi:hypothetical protein PV726_48270 [Streptomyces europaeiscabiei]|uniref:hypothetical protein n=1 Tax=Streptomyces europaeiscabiei TaxID=146819 RepID=UPI0029BEBAC5|nr:hypothetical protein [Streptomyces europaeiscabiei]MDX3697828.1 hypothetical protein [Streptomyces europaeiscabiei]
MPTGDCFCGCGGEAEIGRWFVRGHDITAAAALRAVEGLSLPQRLVAAGFGPERSVVEEAVLKEGWARCTGCAYAGTPAGLAAHTRGGGCAAGPDSPQEPAAQEAGPAARTGPATAGSAPPVRAETGAARGVLLPGADDPSWGEMPLAWRQGLRMPAHQLVTPVKGPLATSENRRLLGAVRAAARMRMTGAHWHLLLTARREDFGSPRSRRAGAVFEALERLVAGHLAPAPEEDLPGPGDTEPAG